MRSAASLRIGLALAVLVACTARNRPVESMRPALNAGEEPASIDVWGVVLGGPEALARLPFESLTLRREGCYGSCPQFEVELRRDGTARWLGRAFTPRFGPYAGKVNPYAYALLCAVAVDIGIENMEPSYNSNAMHDETVVIEWRDDGGTGSVSDYGRTAPALFHAFRALFEEVAEGIDWQ